MTATAATAPPPVRTAIVVPLRRPEPADRNAALRRVRRARTTLEGRDQKFAYLKRAYD